jgi:hypothetical protein
MHPRQILVAGRRKCFFLPVPLLHQAYKAARKGEGTSHIHCGILATNSPRTYLVTEGPKIKKEHQPDSRWRMDLLVTQTKVLRAHTLWQKPNVIMVILKSLVMKSPIFLLSFLSTATALTQPKLATQHLRLSSFRPSVSQLSIVPPSTRSFQLEPLSARSTGQDEETMVAELAITSPSDVKEEEDWVGESQKVELIALGIWLVGLSAFILINNFSGPFPGFMKQIPERWFFLSHMIGGMLFGGGIILTTCIERLVANSKNAPVLQFWFDKVPELDGLIVVPALTVSMISGTGLAIVRYGGLNIAPPHVSAIFWTLIAFMAWWGVTDLSTQGTALKAVNQMYLSHQEGEEGLETPKVVVDRHFSNVISCFFVLTLYSMMVMKPGTLFAFPWSPWT